MCSATSSRGFEHVLGHSEALVAALGRDALCDDWRARTQLLEAQLGYIARQMAGCAARRIRRTDTRESGLRA